MGTTRGILPALLLLAALPAVPTPAAAGDVATFALRGVTIEKEVHVPVAPDEAWALFTGDISGWWDHSFSEHPAHLVIDRTAGGGFWEYFDEDGHGVKHAEVTWAEPGRLLKMRGPLGFSGKAVDFVHTFRFEADSAGTRVHLTLNAAGQLDDDGIAALDQVWDHFLGDRYVNYVKAKAGAGSGK